MGAEIVYCSDCQRRLMQADFDRQEACVIGVRTLCRTCAAPVLAAMTPDQQKAVLNRPGSLTSIRMQSPPAPPPRVPTRPVAAQTHHQPAAAARRPLNRILLPAAVAGGVLCVVGIVLLFGSGKGEPPKPEPTPPVAVPEPPKAPESRPPEPVSVPKGPASPREASALDFLRQAKELGKSNPADVDGVADLCQKAVWEAEGTPAIEEARKALDAALERQKAALDSDLQAIETEVRSAVERKDFGAAVEVLDKAVSRHRAPTWTVALDKKREEVRVASAAAMSAGGETKPPPPPDAPPPVVRRNPERREALSKDAPAGCALVCYLDCGPDSVDGAPGGPVVRLVTGQPHAWPGSDPAVAGLNTTCFFDGREVVFEATGLAPAKTYAVGFSWWDGDQQGRAGSVWASDGKGGQQTRLLDTTRLPGRSQKPAERVLPVPRDLYADGRLRLAFRNEGRPNIAVGELWIWESEAMDFAALGDLLGTGKRAPAAVDIPPGPPLLKGVLSVDPARVALVFNKPLDPATAAQAASYAVAPGVTVASAALEPGGRHVTLGVSPLAPGKLYTVTVTGVKDAEGNVIAADTKRAFTTLRLPLESLALWLRADPPVDLDGDGYVRQWPDRSGKEGHAAQANAVCRPLWVEGALNGQPVVRFDGQDDFLETSKPAGEMSSFSFFIVMRPVSRANHNQTVIARGHWGYFAFHTTDSGGLYIGTSVGSRIAPEQGPGSNTLLLNVWHQFAYVFDGGTASFYRNGRKLASRPMDKPRPWAGVQLGLPDKNTLHGDVAEVMLYRAGLPEEDRRAVERYLHEKYFEPEAGVPPLASLTTEELKLSPELQRRQDEEVKRVMDAFAKDLAAGKTENERAVALWNVGTAKVRDPRIVEKVIPFLTKEGDAMRSEAMAVLAGYPGDKQVATALNTALGANRSRPRVVEKLVTAMVAVNHESSVPFLEQVLRSGDPKLGAAAARALGSFRTDDSVEALLGVYERLTAERMGAARLGGDAKKTVEERIRLFEPPIQESLARLTGQKLAGWVEYKTWWKANKAAFNAPPAATPVPATAAPATYADPLPKIPDAKGYELVYELDLARLGRDITYDKDASAAAKPFERVAYLVELQPEGGAAQFVWVSLDAFTNDVKKIGIPTVAADATFQQKVSNMTVLTNAPGVTPGVFAEGGNIEFWPNNYNGTNGGQVPGADDRAFDFGDQPSNPRDGHGSMQIHNYNARQTLFAINNWRQGGKAAMGIGNSPTGNSDWTFRDNADSYAFKKLRIFVRPKK